MQFALLVTVSCGMYLSAGIWAIVHGQDTREDVRQELESTAQLYTRNSAYMDVWDSLHQQVRVSLDCVSPHLLVYVTILASGLR